MKQKTVYIFRHGETDWNRARRMQGHSDIPLNALGHSQAQQLAQFFAAHPPEAQIQSIISSDLIRAVQTAEPVAARLGVPLKLDTELRETHLGAAEGMNEEEINARFGKSVMEQWRRPESESLDFGFHEGETKRQHLKRLLQGLERYLLTTPHTRVGVSTHGGSLWRLLHHADKDLKLTSPIANCAVYKFGYLTDSSGLCLLEREALHPTRV